MFGNLQGRIQDLYMFGNLQGRIQDLSEGGARFISEQRHPHLRTTFLKIDSFPV